MLKNSILKVKWNKIEKKNSTCTKCPIFQNGLHVDEILILKYQLSGALKDTYVLSIMDVIIIIYQIFNMK